MSPNRIFKNYKLLRRGTADPLVLRRAQNIMGKREQRQAGRFAVESWRGCRPAQGPGALSPHPEGGTWGSRCQGQLSGAEKLPAVSVACWTQLQRGLSVQGLAVLNLHPKLA